MDASAQPTSAGSRLALYVLLALVVLSPWPFGSVHLRTTQAIALISLFAALAAFLWDIWRNRLLLPPRPLLWLLFGLWALAIFQLIPLPPGVHQWLAPGSAFIWHPSEPAAAAVLGPGPHPTSIYPEATRRWLAFATGVAALALAAAPALRSPRILLRSAVTIVAGGLAVAAYGLVARLFFGNKLYGMLEVPTVLPFGPFVSKNHFAGYVEMAAVLAVGLATGLADQARRRPGWLGWISGPRAPQAIFAWGAACVLVLAVPVSLSRGGVLSLLAGLGFFGLLRARRSSQRESFPRQAGISVVVLGLTFSLVVAALPEAARERILTLAAVVSEQSGAYRVDVWRDTVRMSASSPLVGHGFGAYEDTLPRSKTAGGHLRIVHAENDFLELLAEGGGLAAALGGSLVLLAAALGLRAVRRESGHLESTVRAAALAGLVALLVHGLVDFNLRIPSNTLLFACLVSLLVSAAVKERDVRLGFGRLGALLAVGPTLIAAVLASTTTWNSVTVNDPALINARLAGPLRTAALEADIASALRRRPATATAWVVLAWLRLPGAPEEAKALTRWGAGLDPQNPRLRRAAAQVHRR